MLSSALLMESKAVTMSQTLVAQLGPELTHLQEHVRQVKDMAERSCGHILSRQVKIIGDINKL